MADCFNKTQISILGDSLEDFAVNIGKALDEETDQATIELYENTLDEVERTKNTLSGLACIIIGSGRGKRGF